MDAEVFPSADLSTSSPNDDVLAEEAGADDVV